MIRHCFDTSDKSSGIRGRFHKDDFCSKSGNQRRRSYCSASIKTVVCNKIEMLKTEINMVPDCL